VRKLIAIFMTVAFVAVGVADAQNKVDQGRPGNQGAWTVALVAGAPPAPGAASIVQTTPQICLTPKHNITSVGLAAGNTPAAQLAARRFITFTNSPENAGSPKVKCRIDGVAPVMGNTNVGDVLTLGSSITYAIGTATVPQCISDTAATAVISFECS